MMSDHLFDNSNETLYSDTVYPEGTITDTASDWDEASQDNFRQPQLSQMELSPCSPCHRPCPPRPCEDRPCPPSPCENRPCPPVPCPTPVNCLNAYAQYIITGNPASGGYLTFFPQFQSGNLTASNDTIITLSAGYIYLVNYVTLAVPEANQFYQLVPYINGQPRLNYSTVGNASANSRTASATGSFLINESAENPATLQIRITYPDATNNIDVSGVISIIPIAVSGTMME